MTHMLGCYLMLFGELPWTDGPLYVGLSFEGFSVVDYLLDSELFKFKILLDIFKLKPMLSAFWPQMSL